jgi:hypothetical protein
MLCVLTWALLCSYAAFNVVGQDFPALLSHKQIIYVFEEIDTAGNVVHKRSETKEVASPWLS